MEHVNTIELQIRDLWCELPGSENVLTSVYWHKSFSFLSVLLFFSRGWMCWKLLFLIRITTLLVLHNYVSIIIQ